MRIIHGHRKGGKSPTYISWCKMRDRCRDTERSDYGARGITVCARWELFVNFLADMGERPHGTTLDRKDSNGNYCPENCEWANREKQNKNRRRMKRRFRCEFCGIEVENRYWELPELQLCEEHQQFGGKQP